MKEEKIAFCPYCGGKLEEEAVFCAFCGASVADMVSEPPKASQKPPEDTFQCKISYKTCPVCGSRLSGDTVFCDYCGSRVDVAVSPPEETVAGTSKNPQKPVEPVKTHQAVDHWEAPRKVATASATFSFGEFDVKKANSLPEQENTAAVPVAKHADAPRNINKPSEPVRREKPKAEVLAITSKREESGSVVKIKSPESNALNQKRGEQDTGQQHAKPRNGKGDSRSGSIASRSKTSISREAPNDIKPENIRKSTPKQDNGREDEDNRKGKMWLRIILATDALLLVAILVLFLTGVFKLPGKITLIPDVVPSNPALDYSVSNEGLTHFGVEPSNSEDDEMDDEHPAIPIETPSSPTPSPVENSLSFTPSEYTYFAEMEYWIPGWYGVYAGGYLQPESSRESASWYSSNPLVAIVNDYGSVTFMNEGTAVITATVGQERASFSVEVVYRFTQLDYQMTIGSSAPSSFENAKWYHRATPSFVSASSEIAVSSAGTCFNAEMAVDGDIDTSWQENSYGDGTGEWIRLDYDAPISVSALTIWPGYWKRNDLFTGNGRPRSLLISFSEDECVIVELEDSMRCNTIVLSQPVITDSICVRILDVWPGTRWDDTAITEIAVYEQN